ncbi:DUF3301 domain-containing protein [Photobacterium sanguinicancri]|uniref:DUF3301 domain-containing protein n=1 Tax=Photobacterium sanguinicancri TaxID=875932 RepID=A0AAW7YC06_9GAMM|nr:DUF3301 domain-containing protein [Photobacterium sanguinicancri]KXI22883.1 hypothetical protein AS132_10885 [Photobacterium sanguinicancri]MDO6500359.1 DUF3301 domain-containing protein [Photobacterium sanguinicancri]MDO6544813.1 DUF3301 domain-containing protein [Photobacterium sanguinicancri]OZS45746.1 DUF3301 domain-containing protein [Photobacterium sanguinicancri]
MTNLFWIVTVSFGCFLFWQQRRQTELAQKFIEQRCEKLGLQLLSTARGSHKLRDEQQWHWHTVYWFEFSADGQDYYQGYIVMKGFRPMRFYVPPHRLPDEY